MQLQQRLQTGPSTTTDSIMAVNALSTSTKRANTILTPNVVGSLKP